MGLEPLGTEKNSWYKNEKWKNENFARSGKRSENLGFFEPKNLRTKEKLKSS